MTDTTAVYPDDMHNRALLANVHPSDWVNPTPAPVYNLVIIGGGTAGLISAIATAALGGTVALIERHLMGGDCLNVGCVPSKSLIRPARLAAEMKNAAAFGLTPAKISKEDFGTVMQRLRRIRAGISRNDSAVRYRDMGVDVFLGNGVFTGPDTVTVDGMPLRFRKAVIATGAKAQHPAIPGLTETGYLTNETVFNLTALPEQLLVIGGGPLGCELAQAFRRLGSEVTIIQKGRFLPHEDEDASALLADVFRREGITVLLTAHTVSAALTKAGKKAVVVEHDGEQKTITADEILIGAGRVPNVEGMGLESAGVHYDARRGITVDDYLRTTNKRIYGAGDCCMDWKFTHAADAAAQIVVQNALFRGRKKISSLVMPWCTYTDPEIAHVGMHHRDAHAKNIPVDVFTFDMSENDRALADGEGVGFVKVMVKKGTDHILGATIVSAHAGEIISEITAAMVAGTGLGRLARVIHPYPTQADAIKRVAGLYNKTRLTPFVATLLKWWLHVQR